MIDETRILEWIDKRIAQIEENENSLIGSKKYQHLTIYQSWIVALKAVKQKIQEETDKQKETQEEETT